MAQPSKFFAASKTDVSLFQDKPFVVDELVIGGIWCLDSPARFSRGMVDLCLNDPWLSKESSVGTLVNDILLHWSSLKSQLMYEEFASAIVIGASSKIIS